MNFEDFLRSNIEKRFSKEKKLLNGFVRFQTDRNLNHVKDLLLLKHVSNFQSVYMTRETGVCFKLIITTYVIYLPNKSRVLNY